MTHQTIRISLMLWERLLKSLNAALLTALLCVALYALVTNLSEARGAIGKLFVKFTQIESIEGFNVKAAFRGGSNRAERRRSIRLCRRT